VGSTMYLCLTDNGRGRRGQNAEEGKQSRRLKRWHEEEHDCSPGGITTLNKKGSNNNG
jgi:hypothetical protein